MLKFAYWLRKLSEQDSDEDFLDALLWCCISNAAKCIHLLQACTTATREADMTASQ